MLTFSYISNDPELASIAHSSGVDRLFVDWEVHGKAERQGHIDSVKSQHTVEDALKVRNAVPNAELMIRINPLHDNTETEVQQAVDCGADLIMLPMFHHTEELERLIRLVDNAAGIVPLIETPSALRESEKIAKLENIHELYVGLNDLHLALKMRFIFEPLANGLLEAVAKVAENTGTRFGFGGIARVNEGLVRGELILAEHSRLGSSSVILSRTFFRGDAQNDEDPAEVFGREIRKLRAIESRMTGRSPKEVLDDRNRFIASTKEVLDHK
jgi:2-keto-3-deoxy-L-rhamnonate aldolase RhmA